jgi:SAM-dependent methyltransferase
MSAPLDKKPYGQIVRLAERFLDAHGDSYLGVGWTKSQKDADARYRVMLDVLAEERGQTVTLLDFGCGASHLYEYLQARQRADVEYSGLDISSRFLALSRGKFPHVTYYDVDVFDDDSGLPTFDYVIMNGVFTVKCDMPFEVMLDYFQQLVRRVFAKTRKGLAFNVMSKLVDWERDDLFHVPFDVLASFLARDVSRHFLIRHDYGLYEYTAYVYRDPR